MIATASAVAFVVFSCSSERGSEKMNMDEIPLQTVDNMFTVQTRNGRMQSRMEAAKMQHFENDSLKTDLFPDGFAVYSYAEDGRLETILLSDRARHITYKRREGEIWEVTGNVSIQNTIKQETIETDTLFWDQKSHEIYTDSYIRMYSRDGFMQGYGMRSDDKAREAMLMRPFNNSFVVVKDTTVIIVDSVNFIGPFLEK